MTFIHRTAASSPASASPHQALTPQLLTRIRSEFSEMPGLRLTMQQARRLLNLDTITCAAALSVLQAAGFLATTREGAFMLADQSVV